MIDQNQHYKCNACGIVGYWLDFDDLYEEEFSCPDCLSTDIHETDEQVSFEEDDD